MSDNVTVAPEHPQTWQEVLAWTQAFIRDDLRPADSAFEELFLPNSRMSAAERLKVHRNQYWMHVHNTLAGQLPNVQRFMGKPAFTLLTWHFIKANPLRSYSLNHMKLPLPDYLTVCEDFKYRTFIRELAILENACSEVLWVAPQPRLTRADVPDLKDAPRLVNNLKLLALQHRVLEFIHFQGPLKRDEWVDVQPNWLLILCNNERAERWRLTEYDYQMLLRLQAGTAPPEASATVERWVDSGAFLAI